MQPPVRVRGVAALQGKDAIAQLLQGRKGWEHGLLAAARETRQRRHDNSRPHSPDFVKRLNLVVGAWIRTGRQERS